MKKSILSTVFFIITLMLFQENCQAQKAMLLGIEAGPQMSWLANKTDMDNSSYKGLGTLNSSFGLSWQYSFNKCDGIGINVLYSYQGQRYEIENSERYRKVEYLKLPVMYVYTSDHKADVMFVGKIGAQIAMLTNAQLTSKSGELFISNQTDAYQNFEIGAVGYAGVGFKLSENFIFDASLKIDCGFTDAEDKSYKLNINDPVITTNSDGAPLNTRAMTNNITTGIAVGLRYVIRYD